MKMTLGTVAMFAGVAVSASLLPTRTAWALPYSVLLESNADRVNNEIYLANYDSYANLLSNTLAASSAYSALNVSSSFSVGGYTRNGLLNASGSTGYGVLLESNADRVNNEIYIANYATYADLLTNTLDASSAYSALNVSSAFSVGGFTFDGKGYIVLLESNNDRVNNEIYLAYYNSFADLLSNTLSGDSAYSQLNVSSAFSVGGLTYEGGGRYSVLLESNLDRVNNEIYIVNYASYADLLSNNIGATSAYSQLNVSSAFSVGGLAADVDFVGDGGGPGGTPIPEPTTLSLLGLALAGMGLVSRRRRAFR